MRKLIIIAALLIGTPAAAQVSNPPIVSVDTSQLATKAEIQAAKDAAADAKAKADAAASAAATAASTASAAQTAVTGAIKTVNGVTPVNGNVVVPIPTVPDLTPYATTATVNSLINSATSGTIKTVNGLTLPLPSAPDLTPYATTTAVTNAVNNVVAMMPQPGTTVPTELVGGAVGSATTTFMRSDAKPNRITRAGTCVLSTSTGTCTITWATPFAAGTNVNVVLTPVNATTQPVICNTTAMPTVSSVSIRCWFSRPLPATLTVLTNLISYDVFGQAASGLTVQATAIPTTR